MKMTRVAVESVPIHLRNNTVADPGLHYLQAVLLNIPHLKTDKISTFFSKQPYHS